MATTCDVVIIGSGIAGSFLSRQLKLTCPDLDILVLEAATEINDYKVGESTVEISSSYMVRRLGLSTYLYQHQLLKNGLRFFFDSSEKDLPITAMSEMGSDHFPFHPSFQLERASLERDLVGLNRRIGITVELGAKVVDVKIDPSASHVVTWERDGKREEVTARWVCDASGRRQVLQRQLGHKVTKEARLGTSAAWARYRNVAGLDAQGDNAWRARVRHTSRHLSTNHFMYDGYWIWFIPLAGDLMSVGVVFDKDRIPDGPRTQPEMAAFLERHRAPRELLKDAVVEDFQSYAHLPFHSESYFSMDRWALTGEAGAFTDPFYSPGSDFIATANELITSLIVAERSGDQAAWRDQNELANAYFRLKYESSLGLYVKQYPIFGSFDVFRLKYRLDFHNYYNLVYWPFLADKLTDRTWLTEELRFAELQLRAVRAFGEHFARMGQALEARGEYHAHNRGKFVNGLDGVAQLQPKLGPQIDEEYRKSELTRVYADVFTEILERTLQVEGLTERPRVRRELSLPVILALKNVDEECLARLLQRVAGRLTREVRDRFPNDGVEQVALTVDAAVREKGLRRIEVVVTGPTEEKLPVVLAYAAALWNESGEEASKKNAA